MRRGTKYILIFSYALQWLLVLPYIQKFKKAWVIYKYGGIKLCWYCMVYKFSARALPYDPSRNQLSISHSNHILEKCTLKPLISVVVPVYKVACKWLDKCIISVVNQHYYNWELILVDDASGREDLRQLMDKWASEDERIRVYYLQENSGIAGATNFGMKHAKGQFIGLLDHDDELTPDALTWIIWALKQNPEALWLYSDEDLITMNGKCHDPRFKPDFSPEFLLSNMYTCHFRVYASEILNKIGYLRKGFDGSQDHDLALRLSEIVPKENVIHIPRVLYHWREIPGSAATGIGEKPKAPTAGRKAVADALKRRNLKAKVTCHEICPTIYQIKFEPSKFPKVSIIITAQNALLLTKKSINSVRKHSNYPNFEIIVINNAPKDPEFLKYLKKEQSENKIKVIDYNKSFNPSEMNNIATSSVDSEFVLFMHNDIEIISEEWLEQLVAVTELDESIAVVGGLLLYPNGIVEHGGIILGLYGTAGHAHKYMLNLYPGYLGRLHSLQEMSGITASLALVRRSCFDNVGGFDSNRYPMLYNDVDLCIRMKNKGYRCIYNPTVRAIHHETKTSSVNSEELVYKQRLVSDYAEILYHDPFYNPNLALNNEQFYGYRQFPIEDQIPELSDMPKSKIFATPAKRSLLA
jgi:glycosyltransferase involved in cell wall biosynthesis